MKARNLLPIAIVLTILLIIKLLAQHYASNIVYNYTASVPIGFYGLDKDTRDFRVGDLVVYHVPDNVKGLIAERQYIKPGDNLIKPIAAIAGDEVCFANHHILINGKIVNQVPELDTLGKPLPQLHGCQILIPGEYLTLTKYPNSLDGRYHGVINTSQIVGRAVAIFIP